MDAAASDGTCNRISMLDLPPEILLEIFSHLNIMDLCQVALTCKQFRDMAYCKRLWKNEEVSLYQHQFIDEDIVPSLAQRGIYMLDVEVGSMAQLDSALRCFPLLISLNLEMGDLIWEHQWNDLKPLLTGLTSLKRLLLCFERTGFLNDSTVEEFTTILPELVDFSWYLGDVDEKEPVVTSRGLNILLSKLKKLRKFDMISADVSMDYSFDCRLEYLEHLSLYHGSINSKLLETIHHAFPNLLCLKLSSENFTNGEWAALGTLFTNLKKLKKFVFTSLTFVEAVGFDCRSDSLEHLRLNGIQFTTCILETIHHSFPNLRHLQFRDGEYTGSDLAGECLRFLSHLQGLRIVNCRNVHQRDSDVIAEQTNRGLTRFRFSTS